MAEALLIRLIEATERVIAERAREIDLLDAAIGDGDHGTNLARGLGRVAAQRRELADRPLSVALEQAGDLLAEEAGGDGGRLYGALLRGMAAEAPVAGVPDLGALARMAEAGVAALREAGGAKVDDKTMLDVLEPVARALATAAAEGRAEGLGSRAVAAAAYGLHRTSRLVAKHGQAAALGSASVNHLDPGAWSAALIVGAVVGVLEPAA
jgi:phosphoenolpyruvate---glycerone phosphotransferase subunit DhaL